MIDLLGAAAWLIDRFGGRKLGGTGLKVLWLAFFAKLAVPFGLLALVPWSLLTAVAPLRPVTGTTAAPGTWLSVAEQGLLPPDQPFSRLPFVGEGQLGLLLAVPAAVLLSLLAVRVIQALLTVSRLPEIGGDLKLRTEALARSLGLRRPFRLLRMASGASPASWDLFRPAVLLPPGWEDRTPEAEQDQILLHELVHLKNHDPLIGLAAQVLTCLYWFHPLVWVARNRLAAGLENACDQQVLGLSEGRNRTVYGRALLRTLEHSLAIPPLPGTHAAASGKNQLKRRIHMIHDFRPKPGNRAGLVLLAAVFLAAVSLVPASAGSDTPPASPSDNGALVDNIDRPFVDDSSVKGTWKAVDFVDTPSDFVLGKTSWQEPLYLKSLTFYPNGKLGVQATEELPGGPLPWFSWTKGVVMHRNDRTAAAYTIEWRGFFTEVMFFEWKSGDYIFRHQKPKYYVLVRG